MCTARSVAKEMVAMMMITMMMIIDIVIIALKEHKVLVGSDHGVS